MLWLVLLVLFVLALGAGRWSYDLMGAFSYGPAIGLGLLTLVLLTLGGLHP